MSTNALSSRWPEWVIAFAAIPAAIYVASWYPFFARGQFTHHDAASSGMLLFHYGWGLPAFVLIKILQPAFFARGDTRRPMNYSLISVAVNIGLGVGLFFTIGFPGIALATAAASWITVAQMVVRLWRDDTWRPSARASTVWRCMRT